MWICINIIKNKVGLTLWGLRRYQSILQEQYPKWGFQTYSWFKKKRGGLCVWRGRIQLQYNRLHLSLAAKFLTGGPQSISYKNDQLYSMDSCSSRVTWPAPEVLFGWHPNSSVGTAPARHTSVWGPWRCSRAAPWLAEETQNDGAPPVAVSGFPEWFQLFWPSWSTSKHTQGTHVDSILTLLCKTVPDATHKPTVARNNSSLTTRLHTYMQRVNEDPREHSGPAAGSVLAALAWLYKQGGKGGHDLL